MSDSLREAPRCLCGTPGINYAGPERDCPIHGERAGVSDAAVAQALAEYLAESAAGAEREWAMRVALEAARPFMGAAPVASRERVAEVARAFIVAQVGEDMGVGMTEQAHDFASALLAAGVFREPPTREQVSKALQAPFTLDAVLALLGGEEKGK